MSSPALRTGGLGALWVAAWALLGGIPSGAANLNVEISLEAINRAARQSGLVSDSGTFEAYAEELASAPSTNCDVYGSIECPGLRQTPFVGCRPGQGAIYFYPLELSSWSWWVSDPTFAVKSGALEFSATVVTRIDDVTVSTRRTVPAWFNYHKQADELRIELGQFEVPIDVPSRGLTFRAATVDVGRMYGLKLSVVRPAPTTSGIEPGGDAKEIQWQLVRLLQPVIYKNDSVELQFDVEFSQQ